MSDHSEPPVPGALAEGSTGRPGEGPAPASLGDALAGDAVIQTLGDRLRGWLGDSGGPTDGARRQALGVALGGFARAAQVAVSAAGGRLVFVDGADVLARVPLAQALDCATALRRTYAEILGPVVGDHETPTLRVGLVLAAPDAALSAVRQRLLGVLEGGRHDRLAVRLDADGGETVTWDAEWAGDPTRTCEQAVHLLGTGRLSRGVVSHLDQIARTFGPQDPFGCRPEQLEDAVVALAERAFLGAGAPTGSPAHDHCLADLRRRSGDPAQAVGRVRALAAIIQIAEEILRARRSTGPGVR